MASPPASSTAAAIPSTGVECLRWATPLGWAEELRPFADPRPLALLAPVTASALLLVAVAALAVRRDVGSGLLPARDRARPRLRLLGSPVGQALRSERGARGAARVADRDAGAGAAVQGADVSLAGILGAGANCQPAALLFLALGTLAFALVPRAAAAISYGLVGAAFV